MNYRAYIGPEDQYHFLGASQFSLLFALGLKADDQLLDFGCGSLRLGRFLIPYLNKGNYHGIEPNAWLVDAAVKNELGQDLVDIKTPQFSHNDDFSIGDFSGKEFDFIVAQSIFSHTGKNLFFKCIQNLSDAIKTDGFIIATFVEGNSDFLGEEWVYPEVVTLQRSTIQNIAKEVGLVGKPLPWYRPFQTWYIFAKDSKRLPSRKMFQFLRGAVLFSSDHYESWHFTGQIIYKLRKLFRRKSPKGLQDITISVISRIKDEFKRKNM